MNADEIITLLKSKCDPEAVAGKARFGINPHNNLGLSIYQLRPIARQVGRNHQLALQLWETGVHDARLLACFIDNPLEVTPGQMDSWAADFDSWDICDQACTSLFDKTQYAWDKVYGWAERTEEFVKRGAFSLIAGLAVHDKNAVDSSFEQMFPVIMKHSDDERNYVKKAVNWALRTIGKRNISLNKKAVTVAYKLKQRNSSAARWIASDAIRELTSDKIQQRIQRRSA